MNKLTDQYPTQTSLAIESTFFLKDGERDPSRPHRWYFQYPPQWATSDRGEVIVGIRSMWLLKQRAKIEFDIDVVKYKKSTYEIYQASHSDKSFSECFDDIIGSLEYMSSFNENKFRIIVDLCHDDDMRTIAAAVHNSVKSYVESFIDKIVDKPDFVQADLNTANRDVAMRGYYTDSSYSEVIYSERNKNDDDAYGVAFKLFRYNHEFADMFNICESTWDDMCENNPNMYSKWSSEMVFSHLWDRHSCKIYSSIASSVKHNYLTNSNIYLTPIKYYKINSSDQRFWIEFYSSRNPDTPIILPETAGFYLEMLFLPFTKSLYV